MNFLFLSLVISIFFVWTHGKHISLQPIMQNTTLKTLMKKWEANPESFLADITQVQEQCMCNGMKNGQNLGGPNCDSIWQGKKFCYTDPDVCDDGVHSTDIDGYDWSFSACESKPCECNGMQNGQKLGGPNCDSIFEGKNFCYTDSDVCDDGVRSTEINGFDWSFSACEPKTCECNGMKNGENLGGPNCDTIYQGKEFCYTDPDVCDDGVRSNEMNGYDWSFSACESTKPCECNGMKNDQNLGGPNCDTIYQGKKFCYTDPDVCSDGVRSFNINGTDWSFLACATCECNGMENDQNLGGSNCDSIYKGEKFCYTDPDVCDDGVRSTEINGYDWSFSACEGLASAQVGTRSPSPPCEKS